jgi:hypothetical protein
LQAVLAQQLLHTVVHAMLLLLLLMMMSADKQEAEQCSQQEVAQHTPAQPPVCVQQQHVLCAKSHMC